MHIYESLQNFRREYSIANDIRREREKEREEGERTGKRWRQREREREKRELHSYLSSLSPVKIFSDNIDISLSRN